MWFATDSGSCCTRMGRHLQTLLISPIWRELSAPLTWTSQRTTAVVSDNPNSTETLHTFLRYWAIWFNFSLRTPLTELWEFSCQELIFIKISKSLKRSELWNHYRNLSPQLQNANPTCCQVSVAAFHPAVHPPVILQLFDPLRSSTSCFSFANVRKKNKKQLCLTPEATESYHWQKTCPPGSPAWECACLRWGGPWPSARFTSHVFRLAFRIPQRQNKTGLHFINLVDLKFGGSFFIPLNIGIQLKA